MGLARLELALLLLTLLILPFALAVDQQLSHVRSPPFPPALRDRLSPLSAQQELYYANLIERGGAEAMSEGSLDEFCKAARLLCGSALRESAWSTAVVADTVSPAAPFFSQWAQKAQESFFSKWPPPSRTHLGKAETTKHQESASITARVKAEPAPFFGQWRTNSKPDKMGMELEVSQQHLRTEYFREKDLMVGAQLVLPSFLYQPSSHDQADTELKPSFLPASIAVHLPPLDTDHLDDLLQLFHILFNASIVQEIEETLEACEAQNFTNLDSFITSSCVTSIEAMLKFVLSMLSAPDSKIQALANSKVVGNVGGEVTITRIMELAAGHDAVDCHELVLPFKVMGCHRIKESKAILMRVADEEGEDMDLLVACHKNTTLFNPQHEAFAQLRSSPGHTEICHFLPNTDIMWIPI